MKTLPRNRPRIPSSRGMALVLVLSMLALISVLIISFLSSISVETQSSKSYAEGASAKLMADSAVNLVISQLAEATRHPDLAWASQPGMIRTYDDKGQPAAAYKLYSSHQMKVLGAFDAIAALPSEVPPDWNAAAKRSMFTDVNEPVIRDSVSHYPILSEEAVNGSIPGMHTSRGVEMPVRWVYVLKDGSMAALGNGKVDGASAANPIVGRVAFWADDESAKVNVNTASEGTFWARPWAEGATERRLGNRIPGQDEFQTFPGHPATTSLSAVLDLGGATAQSSSYYDITPRVAYGGTKGGSVSAPNTAVALDADRLYASIHELRYRPVRSGGKRVENSSHITPEILDKLQFMLTTSSRAPELNLWNKPRVALWPLQVDPALRNAKDRLLAFSAELKDPLGTGKLPYYFQRLSAWVPPHPCTTPLSSQSPDSDWNQIPRNQELYAYLKSFMEAQVPGFGGRFGTGSGKFGADADQVLTEMMDYLRSQVNTMSPMYNLPPVYSYIPARKTGAPGFPADALPGEGQVVPLAPPNDTRGFGRFTTVTEAAIVFYRSNYKQQVDPGTTTMRGVLMLENFNPTPGNPTWSPHCTFRIRGLDGLKVNGQTVFPDESKAINQVTGVAGRQGGAGHGTAFNSVLTNFTWGMFTGNVFTNDFKALDPTHSDPFKRYTLCTPDITVTGTSQFSFSGGSIIVEIYPGVVASPNSVNAIQTLTFDFPPAGAAPVPELGRGTGPANPAKYDDRIRLRLSSSNPPSSYAKALIMEGDVVMSVEAKPDAPCYGDFRLIAGRKAVPKDFFRPHPGYGTMVGASAQGCHSLRGPGYGFGNGAEGPNADTFFYNQGLPGSEIKTALVPDVVYPDERQPSTAPGLNGVYLASGGPGDWDTGPGNSPDGPYINKSDDNTQEGSTSGNGSFSLQGVGLETGKTYSLNRQIASAISFGSLPVGVKRGLPWQTLAFSPNPAAGKNHPGLAAPGDHLLLDLFTMPIVEPYAISEPFSSAGKVNMNYQIAPFTYLHRSTGIRAVMKAVKLMAIPTQDAAIYKKSGAPNYRHEIEMGESDPASNRGTLKGFEDRFNSGDIFRSASEICGIYLVPKLGSGPPAYDNMDTWWNGYKLTGDNVREEPYGYLYPRLTTKSNTFTVHVRAQTLQKGRGTPADTFLDPGVAGKADGITGEFRGAFTIQRYLDPNADSYAKWDGNDWVPATETDPVAVVGPYRTRVTSVRNFAP